MCVGAVDSDGIWVQQTTTTTTTTTTATTNSNHNNPAQTHSGVPVFFFHSHRCCCCPVCLLALSGTPALDAALRRGVDVSVAAGNTADAKAWLEQLTAPAAGRSAEDAAVQAVAAASFYFNVGDVARAAQHMDHANVGALLEAAVAGPSSAPPQLAAAAVTAQVALCAATGDGAQADVWLQRATDAMGTPPAGAVLNAGAAHYAASAAHRLHNPNLFRAAVGTGDGPPSPAGCEPAAPDTLRKDALERAMELFAAVKDRCHPDDDSTDGVHAALFDNAALAHLELRWASSGSDEVVSDVSALLTAMGSRSPVAQGRALTLLARHHHHTEQAITSEGLFRAAIEKLRGDAPPSLVRAWHHVASSLWYANLLNNWEGREKEASLVQHSVEAEAEVVAEAEAEAGGEARDGCAALAWLPLAPFYSAPQPQ